MLPYKTIGGLSLAVNRNTTLANGGRVSPTMLTNQEIVAVWWVDQADPIGLFHAGGK